MSALVEYILPSSVLSVIQKICDSIGYDSDTQNTYINKYNANQIAISVGSGSNKGVHKSAPKEHDGLANYQRQQARKNKSNHFANTAGTTNDWKSKPAFTVTKFAALDNTQTLINEIRLDMNKLTEKNFNDKMASTMERIKEILDNCSEDDADIKEKMNDVLNTIFVAAIDNKMFELFAKVFANIYETYTDHVSEFIQLAIQSYMESINNIVDVSESDYDEFCEFNMKNTQRKNQSALFCEFAKLGFIPSLNIEWIHSHIQILFNGIQEKMNNKMKQKEIEETTENIVVCFQTLGNMLNKSQYMPTITLLANAKPAENPGFTNRTKFKYMDLAK